jgi:uncharacterized repeat protein (TIGR03803 family)
MRFIRVATTVFAVVSVTALLSAQAQTLKVLYSFTGGADGANPEAGVMRDAKGDLYGTTNVGGAYNGGTVFKLNKSGQETVLHSFCSKSKCSDGLDPLSQLIQDAEGNLYGTTAEGGSNFGTVFQLSKSGRETVLYTFTGGADGANPSGGVVSDARGNLYGTTSEGGAYGKGTVFKLNKMRSETVLHSFADGTDGAYPSAGVIQDLKGNLYGTTYSGGASNLGTVFRLNKAGKETVLYNFNGGTDGADPTTVLSEDVKGNLYGTTSYGGASNLGTVFKLNKAGNETVLYSFSGGTDGAYPSALILDASGTLYGTTIGGGPPDGGTVFKLSKAGKETVLHNFTFGADGAIPTGIILNAKGILWGTTGSGGNSACYFGCGIVFKLTP